MSTPNISIEGTANFSDNTVNNGVISSASFTDSAANSTAGTVQTAIFSLSSINQGAITLAATFNDTATNSPTASAAVATFNGSAINQGTVSLSAFFNGTAVNSSTASVAVATFNDGAINQGTVSLSAFFNDTAVNSSTASVSVAVFTANTVNEGVVTGNAIFEGNASNSATGVIQGDAVFADSTSNEGTVTGDAQIAATATSNGTVLGTPTMYEHPYQYNNYWADVSTLTIGSTILYTGQYTRTLAINANFVIGTDGFIGFGTATTDGDGVVATISLVDHAYQDNSLAYYFDNASLSNGDIVYTGQYTNTVAATTTFYIGTDGQPDYAEVNTNSNGAATITLVEHSEHDDSFTYWWDTNPLADGTTIYTGAYTNSVAANATFSITGYDVTTDSNGIATLTPSSNWYDDTSSLAHTIALSGTITQSDEGGGVLAAAFDGGNNYITTVATGSEFDFTSGDATIEFWFYPTSSTFQYLLLGIETLAVHLWPGNQMTVNNGLNSDDYFSISLNTWQHLAIVISSGSRNVYLNGALVATSTQLLGATTTLYVGTPNAYNSAFNYNGKIAGLRIVKGTAIYTSDFAVPTTPLTDVTGTKLLLNFEASAMPIVPIARSRYGTFGANNYIETSAGVPIGTGDFTIEAFIRPTAINSAPYDTGIIIGVGTGGAALYIHYNNALHFGPNGVGAIASSNAMEIVLDQWQHIAAVRENAQLSLYINGIRKTTVSSDTDYGTAEFAISHYTQVYRFTGDIANVRISSNARYSGDSYNIPLEPFVSDASTLQLALNDAILESGLIGHNATLVGITLPAAPVITSHPQNVVDANLHGVFSITATGTNLEYQWQYSQDNGSTWNDLNSPQFGSNTDTWDEQGQPVNDQLFRCRVSNGGGAVYSNVARISRVDWYDDASSVGIVTLNGNVTQVDEGNGVVVADFEDGYLSVRELASLATGDFTLEYFIKYDSTGVGYQPGVALYTPNTGDNNATVISYIGNANYFNVLMANSTGTVWQTSVPDINAGTQVAPIANYWNHIAVTRTGNTLALYLNGTLIGTNSITESVYNVDRVLEIGRYTAFPGGSRSLNGRIAALRIVRGTSLYSGSSITIPTTLPTAVTGTELLLNFGATTVPTVTPPSSSWYRDTSSMQGSVVLDGTVTQYDRGDGVLAASFNDNGKINANYAINLGANDFSIAAFVKFEGGNGREDRIFNPDTAGSFAVFKDVNNRIATNLVGGGTMVQSNIEITDSNWHYIYVVRQMAYPGSITLFIDGIERGVGTSGSALTDFGSSANNYIGGHAAANTFVGKIAGLRIRTGTIDLADSNIPTSISTAVSGTKLLLNFDATAVPAPIVITSHPQDVVDSNLHGTFSITATGPSLSYQWQYSQNNGISWYDINNSGYGSYTNTFSEQGSPLNNQLYRCKVSNADGDVYSNTARIYYPQSITTEFSALYRHDGAGNTIQVYSVGNGSSNAGNGIPYYSSSSLGLIVGAFIYHADGGAYNPGYGSITFDGYIVFFAQTNEITYIQDTDPYN